MKTFKIQAIRNKTFVPRAIHLGMWLYAVCNGYKPRKTYNHWSVIVDDVEYEALAEGVVRHKYNPEKHEDYIEWTLKGDPKIYLEAQVGKHYEYSNFLFHTLRIIWPKWFGSWNDKKFSCIELCTRTMQLQGYDVDKYMNPFELKRWLDENKKYEVFD